MESIRNFTSIKNIQRWWYEKSPKEKWLMVHDVGAFLTKSIGLNIYGDMKNFWYNHTVTVLASWYAASVTYTLWYYFNEGSFMKGLQCTCTIGIFFTCGTLFVQAVAGYYHVFNSVIEFGGEYIYCDSESPVYNAMYEEMIKQLLKHLTIILGILLASFGVLALNVFYQIIFEKNGATFLSIEFPLFEKNSDIGYALNLSIQFVMCIMGGLGLISIEVIACLANNAMAAIPEIIHLDGKELESEIHRNGMSRIVELRLRSIIMKSADCYAYIMVCCEGYYLRFLEAPILCTYSICFSIFSQLLYGYPSGYALAITNYTLLMLCCDHGNNHSQTYERIALELYNMEWYSLSTSCQKQICSTIHMLQNGVVATFGPFGPLNLESATDLTKSIYKFTMLLIQMFK